jgi:hypothetical protein
MSEAAYVHSNVPCAVDTVLFSTGDQAATYPPVPAARLHVSLSAVEAEVRKAQARYTPFRSAMEGLAIVEEEMDEFKQAVRHGTAEQVETECIQLAAMAVRFLHDIGARHAERNP